MKSIQNMRIYVKNRFCKTLLTHKVKRIFRSNIFLLFANGFLQIRNETVPKNQVSGDGYENLAVEDLFSIEEIGLKTKKTKKVINKK